MPGVGCHTHPRRPRRKPPTRCTMGTPRVILSGCLLSTVVVLASQPVVSQAQSPAQVQIPAEKATPKGWTPPRTPWGDPDLQGSYDNTYEAGTPLEQPAEFAGRRLDEVRGEELARVRRR